MMNAESAVSVIGLGNSFRRDDGVGLDVAGKIRSTEITNVRVFDRIADNAALIESWKNSDAVYIVDALSSGSLPGEIRRFETLKGEMPARTSGDFSTHNLDLERALELAAILDRLPDSLVVYGIEGSDYSPGMGLSPEVRRAASKVSRMIAEEINSFRKSARSTTSDRPGMNGRG